VCTQTNRVHYPSIVAQGGQHNDRKTRPQGTQLLKRVQGTSISTTDFEKHKVRRGFKPYSCQPLRFCRRLCETHPEAKVIVVSTFSDDALVDACIDAGAKGYVIKDIERFDLKRSIRAVQRGSSARASPTARSRPGSTSARTP